jgi:hypothetical protein
LRPRLALATELVLELFDATSGVDKALFAGVDRMGIHGDVTDDNAIFDAINGFLAIGLDSGTRDEILTGGHIPVTNRMRFGMNTFLHGTDPFLKLTLTRLEARIGLADNVGTATATNDLAVRVTGFQGLD